MTNTLVKPRIFSYKHQQKPIQIENKTSIIPPILQSFQQQFLSGKAFWFINEPWRFPKNR